MSAEQSNRPQASAYSYFPTDGVHRSRTPPSSSSSSSSSSSNSTATPDFTSSTSKFLPVAASTTSDHLLSSSPTATTTSPLSIHPASNHDLRRRHQVHEDLDVLARSYPKPTEDLEIGAALARAGAGPLPFQHLAPPIRAVREMTTEERRADMERLKRELLGGS